MLSTKNHSEWSKKALEITFLPKYQKFVNKNDLKGVTPMKNNNLDMKFLDGFFRKI